MQKDMYRYQYYKRRAIIKPSAVAERLVYGAIASGLGFAVLLIMFNF